MDRLLTKADGEGFIYVFYEGHGIFKVGRTNDLHRRMREWCAICPNAARIWLEAFWTPNATIVGKNTGLFICRAYLTSFN